MSTPDQQRWLASVTGVLARCQADDLTNIDELVHEVDDILLHESRGGHTPESEHAIARLLEAKTLILGRAGRVNEELDSLNDLLIRFCDARDERMTQIIGWATFRKAEALLAAGQTEDGLTASLDLLTLFERQSETQDLSAFGDMLIGLTRLLLRAERLDDALRIARVVVTRLLDAAASDKPRRRVVAARGQLVVVDVLALLGRAHEAEEATQSLLEMGEAALISVSQREEEVREFAPDEMLARLAALRFAILASQGRDDEARAVATTITRRLKQENSELAQALISELEDLSRGSAD